MFWCCVANSGGGHNSCISRVWLILGVVIILVLVMYG